MDCVRLAQMELLRWLVSEYGFQREEAWQLMGQVGTMRIGNVVDPCYTVVAKFPKAVSAVLMPITAAVGWGGGVPGERNP